MCVLILSQTGLFCSDTSANELNQNEKYFKIFTRRTVVAQTVMTMHLSNKLNEKKEPWRKCMRHRVTNFQFCTLATGS